MITSDPPAHTRLRKLANKGFMPSMIRNLTPRVDAIALELIEGLRGQREFDFMRDFSAAFPVLVIAEMLGIEEDGDDTGVALPHSCSLSSRQRERIAVSRRKTFCIRRNTHARERKVKIEGHSRAVGSSRDRLRWPLA
jgi:cytochrome P450